MTTKDKILHVVEDLPADASVEEAIERLVFLAKVKKGMAQADADETIAHEEVKKRMHKWLR